MDEDLRVRIARRLVKAEHKLRAAEGLRDAGEYDDAISRAYYAAFHAARAALLALGLSPRTHEGTASLFWQYLVAPGHLERRHGKALHRTREDRENGDYAEQTFFDAEDATQDIDRARELLNAVRDWLVRTQGWTAPDPARTTT